MAAYDNELNAVLVDIFNSIMKIEERSLKLFGRPDLSISEVHLIEAVSKNGDNGSMISEIAADLDITLSSVTVSINKLVKKGYALKARGESDGRTVYVSLTKLGRKIANAHRYFHRQMVRSAGAGFTDKERLSLLEGMRMLGSFFRDTLEKLEK